MKNILRDAYLFAAVWAVFLAGRLALLAVFAPENTHPTFQWFVMSTRFDFVVATYFAIPALVMTALAAFTKFKLRALKKFYISFAIFAAIAIASVNIGFFREYHSQYNYWIQGLFFDDLGAIFGTIWKTYNIPLISAGLLVALVASAFITSKVFKLTDNIETPAVFKKFPAKIAVALVMVFAGVVLIRGGRLSGRPLQMRDIIVCDSDFLNNLVPTSAFCLKNELKKCLEVQFDGRKIDKAALRGFSRELFGSDGGGNLAAALAKTAKGTPLKSPPEHVFFIVCESLSAWPTFDGLKKYNLMPEFERLSKSSVHTNNMLTVSNGTMSTMCSFISGIPFAGILNQSLYKNSNGAFSPAGYMEKLGYETNFFYAGQMSWHDIGNFAKLNGFKNVVGGEKLSKDFGHVEWGIRDDELFDGIVATDFSKPSFNLILTVSNHPPFDIDLKAFGCPNPVDTENQKVINHMWYSDSRIAKFIEKIRAKYPNSVIVVTGDHPARVFPEGERPTSETRMLVPLLISGAPIEDAGVARRIPLAHHIDIIPSIIEMCAPKGFEYSSWGESVFGRREGETLTNNTSALVGEKVFESGSAGCPEELRNRIYKSMELAYWCARYGVELPHEGE